jgi:hypothetical protein
MHCDGAQRRKAAENKLLNINGAMGREGEEKLSLDIYGRVASMLARGILFFDIKLSPCANNISFFMARESLSGSLT